VQPQVGENQPAELSSSAVQGAGIATFFTPEVQYWEPQIVRWAAEHDVDPNAVATIMQIESCGNPDAVSSAGARGLFQVMPFHFSAGEEMTDPETNARRGLNFLNEQLRYTGGDMLLSFAGYNGGYAASGGDFNNWPDETKRYYQWAKGIYEDARAGTNNSSTLETWLDAGGRPGCERAATRLGI
jgi:soluble lytic murein transglycosylase-like protein